MKMLVRQQHSFSPYKLWIVKSIKVSMKLCAVFSVPAHSYWFVVRQPFGMVTALFTKPPDCLPSAGTVFRDLSSIRGLGDFSHSTGSVLSRAVTALFTRPRVRSAASRNALRGMFSHPRLTEIFSVAQELCQSKPWSLLVALIQRYSQSYQQSCSRLCLV